MTARPTARTPPMAGLVNAALALHNERARQRIAHLEEAIVAAHRTQHELAEAAKTTASYRATLAAGYIDLSFLETP